MVRQATSKLHLAAEGVTRRSFPRVYVAHRGFGCIRAHGLVDSSSQRKVQTRVDPGRVCFLSLYFAFLLGGTCLTVLTRSCDRCWSVRADAHSSWYTTLGGALGCFVTLSSVIRVSTHGHLGLGGRKKTHPSSPCSDGMLGWVHVMHEDVGCGKSYKRRSACANIAVRVPDPYTA